MIGFIKFIFVAIVVAVGLAFHVKNDTLVTLNYYMGTIDVSLSVVVISSILIGAVLGMLASLTIILPQRREKSRLNKAVKQAEQEASELRALPLQDAD